MLMEGWYAIIAFLVGFTLAQLWKFVRGWITGEMFQEAKNWQSAIGYVMRSGGMPSGHTASFTAATVTLGVIYGFGSGVFALAVVSLIIVVYDATHVRYAVGEQGKALNKLLKQAGEPELPLVEGHTVAQVAVGMVIGVVVGVIFAMILGKI